MDFKHLSTYRRGLGSLSMDFSKIKIEKNTKSNGDALTDIKSVGNVRNDTNDVRPVVVNKNIVSGKSFTGGSSPSKDYVESVLQDSSGSEDSLNGVVESLGSFNNALSSSSTKFSSMDSSNIESIVDNSVDSKVVGGVLTKDVVKSFGNVTKVSGDDNSGSGSIDGNSVIVKSSVIAEPSVESSLSRDKFWVSPESSVRENNSSSFDSILEDLLDDDDEEAFYQVGRNRVDGSSVENTSYKNVREVGGSGLLDTLSSGVGDGNGTVVGSDVVVKTLAPSPKLPDDEFYDVGVKNVKKTLSVKSARERRNIERVKKYSRTTIYKDSARGLETEIANKNTTEYLVDENGNVVLTAKKRIKSGDEFGKLVEAAESNSFVSVPEGLKNEDNSIITDVSYSAKVIYPWTREAEKRIILNGDKRVKTKINQKELDFFRGLGEHKTVALRDEDILKVVRNPVRPTKKNIKENASVERKRVLNSSISRSRGYSKRAEMSVTIKDLEVIQFLAKFKYATSGQLGAISGVKRVTAENRLRNLLAKGLVERMRIWGADSTWCLSSAGMLLSGFDLPIVNQKTMSYMLIPHQFVVNNTAANLWGGNVNVLNLDNYPVRNRIDSAGKRVFGEEVVSEMELQSSFRRIKLMSGSDLYRPKILSAIEREFSEWESSGGTAAGFDSPEAQYGNEYMWVMYPPMNMRNTFHVPDLVLKRPRNPDGTPESIAIEVELNTKTPEKYYETLKAYKYDKRIYKKVIWICKSLQPAKMIEKAAKEIGLWQEDRIDVVPIITSEGVFRNRDMWRI